MAVLWAKTERPEDKQVEGALQKLDTILIGHSRRCSTRVLGECLLETWLWGTKRSRPGSIFKTRDRKGVQRLF
jgi:hypothetical protein